MVGNLWGLVWWWQSMAGRRMRGIRYDTGRSWRIHARVRTT